MCGGTLIAPQTDDDATMAQQSKHYVASPQASTRAVTGCWLPGRRCGGTETPGSTCQVVCYERRWSRWFRVTARRLRSRPVHDSRQNERGRPRSNATRPFFTTTTKDTSDGMGVADGAAGLNWLISVFKADILFVCSGAISCRLVGTGSPLGTPGTRGTLRRYMH